MCSIPSCVSADFHGTDRSPNDRIFVSRRENREQGQNTTKIGPFKTENLHGQSWTKCHALTDTFEFGGGVGNKGNLRARPTFPWRRGPPPPPPDPQRPPAPLEKSPRKVQEKYGKVLAVSVLGTFRSLFCDSILQLFRFLSFGAFQVVPFFRVSLDETPPLQGRRGGLEWSGSSTPGRWT